MLYMDATTKRYHLMLMALEARVLKALDQLHKQAMIAGTHAIVFSKIAQKKIAGWQLQANALGSQLGIAQLKNELTDDESIAHGYAPVKPIQLTEKEPDKALSIASTIARTAIIEAFRQSAIAVYAANDVDGWIWVAEASACPFCANMNGTIHPISEEFKSHPNCKCSTIPYLA